MIFKAVNNNIIIGSHQWEINKSAVAMITKEVISKPVEPSKSIGEVHNITRKKIMLSTSLP